MVYVGKNLAVVLFIMHTQETISCDNPPQLFAIQGQIAYLYTDKSQFSYEEVHHFHFTYLAIVRRILLNVDINRYSDESVINWFRSRDADCRVIFGIVYYGQAVKGHFN